MSDIKSLNEWQEKEFLPWKESMQAYRDEKLQVNKQIKQHASELKYVVSLLLDKRESEAVKQWNALGLQPQLKSVTLDLEKNSLTMIAEDEQIRNLDLDVLLDELQQMLKD